MDQGEGERDKKAKDEPDVNHLGVRGWRELLDFAREDGRHHQHDGQVHSDACFKIFGLEEGGGIGDAKEENGGQVGGEQL